MGSLLQSVTTSSSECHYQHACVRDLAWAIGSPPLMSPQQARCHWCDVDWYRQLLRDSQAWLRTVDAQPQVLQALLNDNRDRRLGSYFETLWAYYFAHSPRFSLLAHNLQIRQAGRTLGELDFVVHDHVADKTLHIEMAVKFYLGQSDTRQQANWRGPGKKDRLDIKMQSLLQRQSVIAATQVAAEQLLSRGIQVDDCAVILKGRLFYPADSVMQSAPPRDSHPQHLRGRWRCWRDFVCEPGKWYAPQLRSGWLAGQGRREQQGFDQKATLKAMLDSGEWRLPLLLLVFHEEQEVERLFVMPDDWVENEPAQSRRDVSTNGHAKCGPTPVKNK